MIPVVGRGAGEDRAANIGLAVDLGERRGDDVGEVLAGMTSTPSKSPTHIAPLG
jgi:hypothetical protein